jgi:hypothetical protein
MKKYFLLIIAALFTGISIALYFLKQVQPAYDFEAMMVANLVLALLTAIGFLMIKKQLKQDGPHAFVRGVYSATLLKLMVCMGSIFAYAIMNKEHLHKPSVFAMLGIYIIYTFIETIVAQKIAKQK